MDGKFEVIELGTNEGSGINFWNVILLGTILGAMDGQPLGNMKIQY